MCHLFETIRISDGIPYHLGWHEMRMQRAFLELFGSSYNFDLKDRIKVPAEFSQGLVRCNVNYGKEITGINFRRYEKKSIQSLKIINSDSTDYHLKYIDREELEALLALRGDCDEIIIVKDGWVTDTSMSNLIFYNGKYWYTSSHPLLAGTCRERLICQGFLTVRDIRPADISDFLGCKLINSMRNPEEEMLIPISNISL